MTENLVIVESPAKAKTIERYLGPDFTVIASYGHVRDLPENPGKNQLGVDVDHDFAPQYEIVADRRRQVKAIEQAARGARHVFLATDRDREGEAIAWHVAQAAKLEPAKTRRVTFSEITEPAIREAFRHPREIDSDLVDAQQARRVVDRLVGYSLSPLLWRKVRTGLSAGRVQSVAVRLVVERERAIRAFTAREYWTIAAELVSPDGSPFPAELVRVAGRKVDIGDEKTALAHAEKLMRSAPQVQAVSVKRSSRSPAPPFTTSTLQQEASRKLGFSPKRTMRLAQRLYEGVDAPGGPVGFITYMRTDSVALSTQAVAEARDAIVARYGAEFATPLGRVFRTKVRNAQEAHEAIRPTSFARDPETLGRTLGRDEARLYRLIWQRAVASQMAPKEIETTTVDLADGGYELRASAARTTFEGFSRVYTEGQDDSTEELERVLPELAEGDLTAVTAVTPTQHFTEPPPRFTEASLIKALEENGIGRPSTYAATISTIVDRGYVSVRERRLHPEPVAEIVTDLLVDHFGEFVDVAFTARMEEDLDRVASGTAAWVPVVREFYGPFVTQVEASRREIRPASLGLESAEVCSEGHPMVIRAGRFGDYLACSEYPAHRETRRLSTAAGSPGDAGPAVTIAGVGEPCPTCGATAGGVLVARHGRFGEFAGCSRYPDCDFIKRDGPPPPEQLGFEVACPTCGKGHLVARRARRTGSVFWGCSTYPRCRFTTSREPTGIEHAPDQGALVRQADGSLLCLACGASPPEPPGTLPGQALEGGTPDPSALKARSAKGASRGGGHGVRAGSPGRHPTRTRSASGSSTRSRGR